MAAMDRVPSESSFFAASCQIFSRHLAAYFRMAVMTMFPAVLLVATLTLSYALYRQFTRPKPPAPLPPGPRPVPLLGNVANLTSTKELWLSAERWAKQYGTLPPPRHASPRSLYLNCQVVSPTSMSSARVSSF